MAKVNVFEVLKRMNELDTQEINAKQECVGRLAVAPDVVEGKQSKRGDFITIGTPTGTMHKIMSLVKKPTHRAVLLIIHNDEFARIEKELEDAQNVAQPHTDNGR